MKVLVTGGSGRLGMFTVAELAANGYTVINADQREPQSDAGTPNTRFVATDLSDVGQVLDAMRGCEAVIHLGAIPAPYGHPDQVVFENNVRAAFVVLQSASMLGIRRAVIASSVSAYGMAWAPQRDVKPLYAPIDEAHPLIVKDSYGLSKEANERTAAMFARRDGMTIAALRFHWIALPQELASGDTRGIEPEAGSLASNLWGYVDARDAAAACRLAIECSAFGFRAFNITAADTLCALPTENAIRQTLPNTELRCSIPGYSSGFSIDSAARMLKWRPRHSWRERAGSR